MKREELVHIGTCVALHGVKGEVQCVIKNPVVDEQDLEYLVVEIDGTYVPFFLEEYRWKSDTTLLLKFVDIDSQRDAMQIVKRELYIPANQCSSETTDTDYASLIGYSLIDVQQGRVGIIENIDFITPENAILLLDNQVIIPLHADLVQEVNHADKSITMTLPEGLL